MSASIRQVRLICTDKGTHPTRELGVIHRNADNDEMTLLPTDRAQPVVERAGRAGTVVNRAMTTSEGRGIELSDLLWSVRCPTCSLHVEWKDDRAVSVVDEILSGIAGARVTVDLSALPARFK